MPFCFRFFKLSTRLFKVLLSSCTETQSIGFPMFSTHTPTQSIVFPRKYSTRRTTVTLSSRGWATQTFFSASVSNTGIYKCISNARKGFAHSVRLYFVALAASVLGRAINSHFPLLYPLLINPQRNINHSWMKSVARAAQNEKRCTRRHHPRPQQIACAWPPRWVEHGKWKIMIYNCVQRPKRVSICLDRNEVLLPARCVN